MMTTTHRIFRNCLVALPLVVLSAGALGGPEAAASVTVAGFVAVVNLAAFAWIGSGFVHSIASGDGGGIHGALVAVKLALTIPLYSLLFVAVGPLYTVVGSLAALGGIALTGLELAVLDAWSPPLATPDATSGGASVAARDVLES